MSQDKKPEIQITREFPPYIHEECHREKARALFEDGNGYKMAARILGLSIYTVREWYQQWRKGEFTVERSDCLKVYDDETKRRLTDFYKKCRSGAEFTRSTGVSATSARRWMKEMAEQDALKKK